MTSEAKMTAADAPIVPAGALFQVRRDIAFLNHGSYGACPRPVFEVYQQLAARAGGAAGGVPRAAPERAAGGGARARSRPTWARHADNLVFVPNATYGMNIVARSLELRPGDEVLGTDHEYGAVARTWRFVCGPRGATYRAQPIPLPVTDADALVERLWEAVTERTRVIVVSHITSPTALSFPVAAICRRAAAHGILTVVDGAHAPGQIDLALDALGVDFYTGNLHKWLCAPKGSGFLYARPERQSLLRPLAVSWGWEAERPGPSPFQDYFEWTRHGRSRGLSKRAGGHRLPAGA